MTLSFLPADLTERIGWLLVHSIWQFGLAALFAIVLLRILQNATAQTRYLSLLMLFAGCALLPVAGLALPSTTPWSRPVADLQSTVETSVSSDIPAMNVTSAESIGLTTPDQGVTQLEIAPGASSETSDTGSGLLEAARPSLRELIRAWLPTLVCLWVCGLIGMSCRGLLCLYTIRRLRMVGISAAPNSIQDLLRQVSVRLRLRAKVRVLQSTLIQIPAVVGYVRPIVLLPVSVMTGLPLSQVEAILAH